MTRLNVTLSGMIPLKLSGDAGAPEGPGFLFTWIGEASTPAWPGFLLTAIGEALTGALLDGPAWGPPAMATIGLFLAPGSRVVRATLFLAGAGGLEGSLESCPFFCISLRVLVNIWRGEEAAETLAAAGQT